VLNGQSVHSDLPVADWNLPLGQLEHWDALLREYVPLLHGVHMLDPCVYAV
jgi:hypothetical protein